MMGLPLSLAHRRYIHQACWTQQLRRHIFRRAGLPNARRVLEIGCGTGAIQRTITHGPNTHLFGLDIDRPSLLVARGEAPRAFFANGDAHRLPFSDHVFDITFFHFVLLWLSEPASALLEARRVTRPGGAVIAFAEPDYGQRKPSDPALSKLARLQFEALRAQGADPNTGSRLRELFAAAQISVVESDRLETNLESADPSMELEVLKQDLKANFKSEEEFSKATEKLISTGFESFLVPTFYCWGQPFDRPSV